MVSRLPRALNQTDERTYCLQLEFFPSSKSTAGPQRRLTIFLKKTKDETDKVEQEFVVGDQCDCACE